MAFSLMASPGGSQPALNITALTTIKTSPGVLFRVVVVTPPTAIGGIYDSATTSGLGASNLIAPIGTGLAPAYIFDLVWPCKNGITINPGTGGVMSVSFN